MGRKRLTEKELHFSQELGGRIAKIREFKKLSQEQLGILAFRDVTPTENAAQQRISAIETNSKHITAFDLFRIIKAL